MTLREAVYHELCMHMPEEDDGRLWRLADNIVRRLERDCAISINLVKVGDETKR